MTITPSSSAGLRTIAGLTVSKVEQRSDFLNVLIYGESGTGKTTLAGSADAVPAMRPVLVVDVEGGTESLRRTYPDVDVVRVTNWDEMQDLYNVLYEGKHEYRTVVLDSLTEIQKFSMYQIMLDVIAKDRERDPDIASMREWGKNIEQIRRFVRGFRDLDMNTIFTALVRVDKNQRTGKETMLPMLSGKLASEVAAFLDIVGYYYVKPDEEGESKRWLLTQKTEEITAKDRTGTLPLVVEEPTMKSLLEIVNPPIAKKAKAAVVSADSSSVEKDK